MKSTIKKRTEGYGYKYTELADINKYCEANDIRYYQETETSEINQKDYIVTYISNDRGGNYEKHRGCQIVEAVLQGIKNPVQEYGSSLTYCRRYSLLMALGLATEDDDAASLTIKKEATIEDAEKWTFPFGKYKDRTMKEILKESRNYVDWYINNKANEYDIKCYELLSGNKVLNEEESLEKIALLSRMNDLVIETDADYEELLNQYGVKTNKELSIEQLKETVKELEERENSI